MRRLVTAAVLILGGAVGEATTLAAGFDPRVVTFGSERQELKSRPIEQRPNRPLHVYGNTVRRRSSRQGR